MTELLYFYPETGIILRRNPSTRTGVDSIAGSVGARGYRCISVDYKIYKAHRLMWFYVYKKWPKNTDHINGNKDDNRIVNLRECSSSQNNMNKCIQSNNTSGFKGVSFHKRIGKWYARIGVGRTRKSLGYFDTPDEAYAVYKCNLYEYHGHFAREV